MRVFLATTIASLILLAGCASTPFDPVEAPDWQSGYAYTYELTGDVEGKASFSASGQDPETETFNETFGPTKAFSYEIISTQGANDTYIAAFLTHDSLGGLVQVPQAAAVRKADLTFLWANIQGTTLSVMDTPAVDLAFPLTAGKTWGFSEAMPTSPETAELGNVGDFVFKAEATKATNVKIGNDTVQAIEVVHRISVPGIGDMMKEAEAEMKAQGLDGSISASLTGKRTILYSEALEAIVRDTVTMNFAMSMTLSYEGQSMSAKANSRSTMVLDLVGMDRLPEADRDLTQAVQFLTSGQAIEAPGVLDLPGEAFPLSINQSAVEVNAADAPTVTFTAVGAIPEGATLAWGIFDAAGSKVADGEGDTLAFKVDKPGAYGVQVVGRDANGRLAASSSTLLIGDYDGTVALTCGPVSVTAPMGNAGQTCTQTALEVPQGMLGFSLALNAGATGPAPGTFRVGDGAQTVNQDTDNGMATINSGNLNAGSWNMQWRPTAGVNHSPSVQVTLDYGSAPKAPDAMESTFAALRALDLPFELPF